MVEHRCIAEAELRAFHPGSTLAGEAQALLLQQQSVWELARLGYKSLDSVRTKAFDFDGITSRVQFNPGRLKSTSAKVDARSIRSRPCFLCEAHLPPEQKGILYRDEFLLLVNPYPICPEHFTIACVEHVPQQIGGRFRTLLDLARDLAPEFVVLYNGPQAGASAPDHMHFQAGTKAFLPVADEYLTSRERFGRLLVDTGSLRVYSVDGYIPAFVALESSNLTALVEGFTVVHEGLRGVLGSRDEAMMNLVCWFEEGEWTLVVFPRSKHRPARFFAADETRIMLSPAAVDLAGVPTIPVEADFQRVDRENLEAMLEEVSLRKDLIREVTGSLVESMGR